MYPISVYFGMVIQFLKTMTKNPFALTINPPAEGLDEGCEVDLFLLLKYQHQGKSLCFCHYTSHKHPINIAGVFLFDVHDAPQGLEHVNCPS